jgi:transposase
MKETVNENVEVRTERVDDIPLLLAQMEKLGVAEVLDEHIKAHGLRQGLSIGQVVTVWLSYILSQGDHRKSYLEGWAEERLETLSYCLGTAVEGRDVNDDRLTDVLRELSDDEQWSACEQSLNARSLRVYRLTPQTVRLDSTTVSSYGCVDENGLLQFGHSKDRRPDLPQVKVATTTLDPLGMPLCTLVVSGEKADDPLYEPLIKEVRASLGQGGLLYVGDSKMAAITTRAALAGGGDYYLCPLAKAQVSDEQLSGYLQAAEDKELFKVYREDAKGEMQLIAQGFEVVQEVSFSLSWTERRLLVCSLAQAEAETKKHEARLAQAQRELAELTVARRGKRRLKSRSELEMKVNELLKRHRVKELLKVDIEERRQEKQLRAYGERPARTQTHLSLVLHSHIDEAALEAVKARLGWRVLATNQHAEQLPFAKAVLAYRDAYLHEQGYSRLKGQPLSLTPMYLQLDEQIKGLIRLLSLGLRVLTLLEFVVRRELALRGEQLSGLYAGNAKRKTARPSAELLLYAFREITLTIIRLAEQVIYHVRELSQLQRTILQLLGLDEAIYTNLTLNSGKLDGI